MFGRKRPKSISDDASGTLTPQEEEALASGFDRYQEEKRRALADPGPSWKEWMLHDFAKWWMGLLFVILDSWLAAFWFEPINVLGLVASLALAVYAEYLVYQYFWHRPPDETHNRSARFRASWRTPFRYGRWTEEGERARAGRPAVPAGEGSPDPTEFM